jgi:hypothetical protein
MRKVTRIAATLAALISASLLVTGCAATTSSEGSRATLYADATALAGDSSAVVEVVVESQESVQEELAYTLSTVTVIASVAPQGLAANSNGVSTIAPEEELVIRQLGPSDQSSDQVPILETGERYLLFLTPTMLDGDAASQYYVTGASAGIYQAAGAEDGENVSYARVDADSGDTLPATLTTAELDD